jgi:hypothetical protein
MSNTRKRYGDIKVAGVMAGKEAYIWTIKQTSMEVFI